MENKLYHLFLICNWGNTISNQGCLNPELSRTFAVDLEEANRDNHGQYIRFEKCGSVQQIVRS